MTSNISGAESVLICIIHIPFHCFAFY